MYYYEIQGGRPLGGTLAVQGAKNSVLPILTAALLAPGESVLHNCPDLSDVETTLAILERLGCRVAREGDTLRVDSSVLCRGDIPEQLTGEMRSSILFLGALLGRLGEGELAYPGGCQLGPRPIDLHLSALRALGAAIREEEGLLRCTGGYALRGRELCLALPSVGATENIMLAACGCPGVTTIVGAAREPEIVDLQQFLRAMGAEVSGAGGDIITIQGGKPLRPAEYRVMGDRMVAATYLCALGAAGGEAELTGVDPSHLTALLACLEEGGCALTTGRDRLTIRAKGPFRAISPVRTAPYPGFPTDAQAVLMAALAGGAGTTLFEENMFASRYRHVDDLCRMGADIRVSGRVAVVTGRPLHGAQVRGTDLRGCAALIVAALGAEGTSRVSGLDHLYRGYDGLDRGLRSLGAQLQTIGEAPWQQRETNEETAGAGADWAAC